MLCGIPASGKSTVVEAISKMLFKRKEKYAVICPDTIRAEIGEGEHDQTVNTEVFQLVNTRIMDSLSRGLTVIYDATNTTKKARKSYLKITNSKNIPIIAVWVDTKVSTALKQNRMRSRNVPEHIIKRFHIKFTPPTIGEGFDGVLHIDKKTDITKLV